MQTAPCALHTSLPTADPADGTTGPLQGHGARVHNEDLAEKTLVGMSRSPAPGPPLCPVAWRSLPCGQVPPASYQPLGVTV